MVETEGSKRVQAADDCGDDRVASLRGVREDASTQRGGYSAWVWLNVICLDAPIVAVSWHWLFAHRFGLRVAPPAVAALFLTAWLIYLGDRFGDSLSIKRAVPTSLRQRFALKHRVLWVFALLLIAAADAGVIFFLLDRRMLLPGASVGAGALFYLGLNQLIPAAWRILPLKEISIGTLFAAGTVVALKELPGEALPAWILFASLGSLNCICIAVWERNLDDAQLRVSIATAFPQIERWLLPALFLLALTSLVLASHNSQARGIYLCTGASAALLATLHLSRSKMRSDSQTALADLVLLPPLLALVCAVALA